MTIVFFFGLNLTYDSVLCASLPYKNNIIYWYFLERQTLHLVFLDNYNIGVPALCNLKILHSAKNFTDHNRYNLQISFNEVPYEELLSKITTKDVG